MENRVVVDDSGRAFNKNYSREIGSKNFQNVIAENDGTFKLTVKTNPTDLWVEYLNKDYLIGDFAIRQKKDLLVQDRSPNKTNRQNLLEIVVAVSLHVRKQGENIHLITNCPPRDWDKQRDLIAKSLIGPQEVIHKAGDLKGKKVEFFITQCNVIPEAEAAYYGYCYDLNLNLVHSEVWKSRTLIIDIGDQTCNYVSMNPEGDVYDSGSDSLEKGMFIVYAELQKWLMQKGVEKNQAEIIKHIIYGEPIMDGGQRVFYEPELNRCYAILEQYLYSQLNALLKMNNYQNLLLCGGSAKPMYQLFKNRYPKLNVICSDAAQMLNCYGAYILYRLSQ